MLSHFWEFMLLKKAGKRFMFNLYNLFINTIKLGSCGKALRFRTNTFCKQPYRNSSYAYTGMIKLQAFLNISCRL